MEFVITPEALAWLKVAGWLFIGGCATAVLAFIWRDDKKNSGWQDALQKEKQKREKVINHDDDQSISNQR